ncbi:unnamed protein product [Polarella glacialis]|uniref:Fe2OG dioxygenase domain-containing protein n=1 Tax=Polarella glacialis TaxID=89957 RepID=A0A813FZK0_POLGL|nr:unnamed protein product [Polarella glacialis]
MTEGIDPAALRLVGPWNFHFDFLAPGPRQPRWPWESKEDCEHLETFEAPTEPVSSSATSGLLLAGGYPEASPAAAAGSGAAKQAARKGSAGLARGFLNRTGGGGASAAKPHADSARASSAGSSKCSKGPTATGGSNPSTKKKKLPSGYHWTTPPQCYEFTTQREVKVEEWQGVEQMGQVQKRSAKLSASCFYRLPGLLPAEQVESILAHCKQSSAYKIDDDSVDKTPTFEYYPFRDGEWVDQKMRSIMESSVESRVLPYIRERYDCRFCALSDILVRRYLPGERRTHAVHFDGHAFVTAVLGLSSADEYEGGLYLQPEPDVASRTFFRIEPGDLVVHSFDLQHGVHVWKGVRYSLIFWIKDSLQAVREHTTPWYQRLADEGDPDALYNVAQNYEHGTFGNPVDLPKAVALYERSAATGHHFAQNNLGLIYRRAGESGGADAASLGRLSKFDLLQKSVEWLKAAAEGGFAMAQKNLALAYANGQGVRKDDSQAVAWMRRAAEQLEVEAAYMMGEMYRQGRGVPSDASEAAKWYERSAECGFPKAQYTLGMLYLEGTGLVRDAKKAELWLRFASRQGSAEAKNNLATLHAQSGEVDQAAEIWAELARGGEVNAQCNLGMCYMRGAGRDQDLQEASRWLSKAAAQGHQMASQALAQLGV